jgi:hypothetical protein
MTCEDALLCEAAQRAVASVRTVGRGCEQRRLSDDRWTRDPDAVGGTGSTYAVSKAGLRLLLLTAAGIVLVVVAVGTVCRAQSG